MGRTLKINEVDVQLSQADSLPHISKSPLKTTGVYHLLKSTQKKKKRKEKKKKHRAPLGCVNSALQQSHATDDSRTLLMPFPILKQPVRETLREKRHAVFPRRFKKKKKPRFSRRIDGFPDPL